MKSNYLCFVVYIKGDFPLLRVQQGSVKNISSPVYTYHPKRFIAAILGQNFQYSDLSGSIQHSFFLLQAEFFFQVIFFYFIINSHHCLLCTYSFINVTVWTLAQFAYSNLWCSFSLNQTMDISSSSTKRTGRTEGVQRGERRQRRDFLFVLSVILI